MKSSFRRSGKLRAAQKMRLNDYGAIHLNGHIYEVDNNSRYSTLAIKKDGKDIFFAQGQDVEDFNKDASGKANETATDRQIVEYLESAGAI